MLALASMHAQMLAHYTWCKVQACRYLSTMHSQRPGLWYVHALRCAWLWQGHYKHGQCPLAHGFMPLGYKIVCSTSGRFNHFGWQPCTHCCTALAWLIACLLGGIRFYANFKHPSSFCTSRGPDKQGVDDLLFRRLHLHQLAAIEPPAFLRLLVVPAWHLLRMSCSTNSSGVCTSAHFCRRQHQILGTRPLAGILPLKFRRSCIYTLPVGGSPGLSLNEPQEM